MASEGITSIGKVEELNIPLSNKITDAYLRRYGRVVTINSPYDFSKIDAGENKIGQITNAKFCPQQRVILPISNLPQSQRGVNCYLKIETDGSIYFYWGTTAVTSVNNGAFYGCYMSKE